MRRPWLALITLSGCSFAGAGIGAGGDATDATSPGSDGPGAGSDGPGAGSDGPGAAMFCPPDPSLRLCYSFDQPTYPAALPNEGAATIAAQLTNVTRIASGTGGAALLGQTSGIYLPMSSEVTGVLGLEVWFRIDTEPNLGGRSGLVDSNVNPNISLFFYRQVATHQLRCGIGDVVNVWNVSLAVGPWIYVACVCEGPNLALYLDGALVGATPGACSNGGAFVVDGFTIGSNNGGGNVAGDRLLGAIDGLRLWNQAPSAAAICLASGRPGC